MLMALMVPLPAVLRSSIEEEDEQTEQMKSCIFSSTTTASVWTTEIKES
jgi:hypothetical protein